MNEIDKITYRILALERAIQTRGVAHHTDVLKAAEAFYAYILDEPKEPKSPAQ